VIATRSANSSFGVGRPHPVVQLGHLVEQAARATSVVARHPTILSHPANNAGEALPGWGRHRLGWDAREPTCVRALLTR